jgi:hypothetical protein
MYSSMPSPSTVVMKQITAGAHSDVTYNTACYAGLNSKIVEGERSSIKMSEGQRLYLAPETATRKACTVELEKRTAR